ncbi:MAG: GNAT family N-acetyltransferase [Bacteroidetes bacterium]|nr:GNAT family N-acetyltransferase [Bacteroidota bacterium]
MTQTLQNEHIYLRAIEPEDFVFLSEIENDERLWLLGSTVQPFSEFVLREYLKNAKEDIYTAKQLRLVICLKNGLSVGLVDLFDFDVKNKKAGVGIVILEKFRSKGVGFHAMQCVMAYAKKHLDLHQLYANILLQNVPSLHLFDKCGFQTIGIKQDWIYHNGKFEDEALVQLILT